ncbi:unnamed protein product, partial [Mesorhabditis spiculigera]
MNRFCRDFAALKTDVKPKYKTVRRDAYTVDRGAVKLLRKCHGFTTTLRPSHEIERMSKNNLYEGWEDYERDPTNETGALHRLRYVREKLVTGSQLRDVFGPADVFCGAGDYSKILSHLQRKPEKPLDILVVRLGDRLLLNLAEPWRGDVEAPLTDEEKKQRILGQNLEKFTTTEEHWRDVTQGEGDVKNFRYFVDAVSTGNGPTILVAHEVDHVHYDGARSVDTKTFCAPGFSVKRPAVEQLKAGHILQWVGAPRRASDVTLCRRVPLGQPAPRRPPSSHPDTIMDKRREEDSPQLQRGARLNTDDFFRQLKDLVPGEPFFKKRKRYADNYNQALAKGTDFFGKLLENLSGGSYWQITIVGKECTAKPLDSLSEIASGILPTHEDKREQLQLLFEKILNRTSGAKAAQGAPPDANNIEPITWTIQ